MRRDKSRLYLFLEKLSHCSSQNTTLSRKGRYWQNHHTRHPGDKPGANHYTRHPGDKPGANHYTRHPGDKPGANHHICHPGKIAGGYLIRDLIYCHENIINRKIRTDPG
jgi:hypothetical protein